MHPVTIAESETYNLIITTSKCQRIYLRLRTEPREECCDRLDEQRELESLGLQSDNLIVDKIIRGCWEVAETQSSLPEHAIVTQNPSFAKRILHEGLFNHRPVRSTRNTLSRREPVICHYDNGQSLYIY